VQNHFDRKHFANIGALGPTEHYIDQFIDGFGELPKADGKANAIEFGCGVSPYVDMIRRAGYRYTGVDASPWACDYMRRKKRANAIQSQFEDFQPHPNNAVALAAHVIEHVDAVKSLSIVYRSLLPGGIFYMLIPEGTDLYNQDHLWFFTEASAIRLLEETGFTVQSSAIKNIVPKERFMYFVASKP